jgi:glycosyltransferase involved in cell wall biosynthesis
LQDMGAKGIYRAMNVALAQSTGTWVLFLGHDDRLADPSVLEVASKSIKASSFCFWRQAYYGSVLIDGDAGWAKGGAVYDGKFNFAKLLRRNICHQAIFYRGGDFQGSCHSWAAIQAAWIKGSARFGLGSSVGLLIHTSTG